MKANIRKEKRNLVGDNVKAARLGCKPEITQQELSARLVEIGIVIDRTAIYKIEAGQRIVTDYELSALSRILNVSLDWLCEHDH